MEGITLTPGALVWITARDGSIHATRPPIFASGQPTLCARWYDRLDLRVRTQLGLRDCHPVGACPVCRSAGGLAASIVCAAKHR